MAKNISLMGASYSDVPAVVLPQTGGGTASFTDVTDTTATASDVLAPKVFYSANGVRTVGTGTGSGGLTDDVKTALLNCFEHVAWIDDQGQTYYDALYSALHGGLVSISAVYTQTATIYTTDDLDTLRPDLVVTATYGDGTTREVTAYTLSGTLTIGTSTVTVTYQGQTDTFSVTVTDTAYITAVFTQPQTTIYTDDSLDSLKSYLVVTYYTAPGATGTVLADSAYTLIGTLTEGTSVITAEYQGLTDTFNVTVVLNPLLYNWDFTKSLTDTKNGIVAQPIHGEGCTAPTRNGTGVVYNGAGQAVRLFGEDWSVSNLLNKTIQVDVATYSPVLTNTHVRLVVIDMVGTGSWSAGFVFRNNHGWSIYGDSYQWSDVIGEMTSRTDISGHTVSLYVDNNRFVKVYIDGQLKGVSSVPLDDDSVGLQIGSTATSSSGISFYNATISGVRIFNGDISTNINAN